MNVVRCGVDAPDLGLAEEHRSLNRCGADAPDLGLAEEHRSLNRCGADAPDLGLAEEHRSLNRCGWVVDGPQIYLDYHDNEWGRPLRGTRELFERIVLESFQSGLSWLTILRKRENFRAAFAGFDVAAVAAFGDDDVARLLGDAGIVRNRAKIEATIANARAVEALEDDLSELLWSFAPEPRPRPATPADVPAVTPESTAMAKELKRRGFRFVGPTTAYALMQATGMVDDHVQNCWVPAV